MDDPRWLRLITIGLVLAALAVGYFLLSGRLFSNSQKTPTQVSQASPSPTMIPIPSASPSPSILGQNNQSSSTPPPGVSKGGAQTLPRTGFPLFLVGVFSAAAIASGLGLRKFPH